MTIGLTHSILSFLHGEPLSSEGTPQRNNKEMNPQIAYQYFEIGLVFISINRHVVFHSTGNCSGIRAEGGRFEGPLHSVIVIPP